jgi:hypothetical protein
MPYGPWQFILIYQKYAEKDHGVAVVAPTFNTGTGGTTTTLKTQGSNAVLQTAEDDADMDAGFAAVVYSGESWKAGLLYGYVRSAMTQDTDLTYHAFDPFFNGQFGPLNVQAEMVYQTGDTVYNQAAFPGTADLDKKELAWNVELGYDFGVAKVLGGYLFFSGDNNGAADNEDSAYEAGVGTDWEPVWLLCTDEDAGMKSLGGVGNFAKVVGAGPQYGANIFYIAASFSPMENVTLGAAVAKADADEVNRNLNFDDDYGTEYDVSLMWQIHPNLTYRVIGAWLATGDFFQGATPNTANFDDIGAIFQEIQISF